MRKMRNIPTSNCLVLHEFPVPPNSHVLETPLPVLQHANGQRGAVFCNLSTIPWKIASASSEPGVPVGISPGGTGASILTKLLNRVADGSTTMLVQLPPGGPAHVSCVLQKMKPVS